MSPAAPGAPVTIRPVRREEVPRVWEMLRGLAEYEKMTDILTGDAARVEAAIFGEGPPRVEVLVADDGADLLGYALFYPVFGSFRARWRLWLEDLYVKPEARSRGAGVLLMSALCRIAVERGWFCVDWEVLDWNESALDFYRRIGGHDRGSGWLNYRIDGDAMRALAEKYRPR